MQNKRMIGILIVLVLLFCLLGIRLTILTEPGSQLSKAAVIHDSYNITIPSTRGTIYDSSMRPLVNTQSVYYAAVSPTDDMPKVLSGLSPYVSDMKMLEQKLSSRLPFVIEVSSPDINVPGVTLFTGVKRYSDDMTPQFIGYLDNKGDGATGIEKAFNSELKTYSQTQTISFPVAAGNPGGVLERLQGLPAQITSSGRSDTGGVVLTLDSDIQQAAQRAADKYIKDSGCILVMDPKSGDILASVSSPKFSPNDLAGAIKGTNSPLLNKALLSYNLGSVFKIVMVASALENGIDPSLTYTSTGAIYVKGRSTPFRDADAADFGTMDMAKGFANSCNTYFINLGEKIGGDPILNMAKKLRLGEQTSLAPGLNSVSGNLPTESDLQMPAELANFSIGQGKLLVTPVQVASIVSTVVNGGLEPTPRLVKELIDNDKKVTKNYPTDVTERIFSSGTANFLKQFMIGTVNEGTGTAAQPTYGGAGGKTGTAQTGMVKNGKFIDQAWFAGFYPADTPKYVIVALVENGTSGGADAGPVFKYIADYLASRCGYPTVNQ